MAEGKKRFIHTAKVARLGRDHKRQAVNLLFQKVDPL
jgi:hypothetical protein